MVKFNATTKKSVFELKLPEAQTVSLLGDFNEWDPTKHVMKKGRNGVWKTEIKLAPGEYQFLYFADQNRWLTDDSCSRAIGGIGTENSVAVVQSVSAEKKITKKAKTPKRK